MKKLSLIITVLALTLTVLISPCAPEEMTAEQFYQKNTVTMIVPSGAGGGTDFAGRLFASYWHDATGGAMVVKNVPGGGGLVGMNQLYRAKPDGLTIGTAYFDAHLYLRYMLDDPAVKFKLTDFNWGGAFADEPYVFAVSTKNAAKSMADLQKMTGLKFGANTPMNTSAFGEALVIEVFGLKDARIITGMRGPDCDLALAKGEIDGYCYDGGGVIANLQRGYVKPPFVYPALKRTPWFPDTPAITELVTLTPRQMQLARAFERSSAHKPIILPPGVPADRIQFMRQGFGKIMENKGFQRQGAMRWAVLVKPMSGEEWEAYVKEGAALPREDLRALLQMAESYVKVK